VQQYERDTINIQKRERIKICQREQEPVQRLHTLEKADEQQLEKGWTERKGQDNTAPALHKESKVQEQNPRHSVCVNRSTVSGRNWESCRRKDKCGDRGWLRERAPVTKRTGGTSKHQRQHWCPASDVPPVYHVALGYHETDAKEDNRARRTRSGAEWHQEITRVI